MQRYNPKDIETKWQDKWEADKTYQVDLHSDKQKYIGFGMFNYPSGAGIHIGHGKNFTLPDVIVRARRQQGYQAYMPVGFDSFGLPAENYAIRTGTPPRETTDKAIANYRTQYRAMGWSMDWSKEIDTSQPDYYRWTQWIFTKLFEHGLAYQKESAQWWCPHDMTVLANEQVEGGKCWRCGHVVEKKLLKQWFFKITDYADEILDATDDLDWTESVKTQQKNWIGRSIGAEVDFILDATQDTVKVFTTRPDTLFGATFLVIAPEHPLIDKISSAEQKEAVDAYVKATQAKSEVERQVTDREKTGVFTGAYATNPINGEKVPVWTADYVLFGYGTGAIMAVPAHDERDYAFAKKFSIEMRQVVLPIADDAKNPPKAGFEDVRRDTVIVHLKDKSTGKFALLDWHGTLEGITTAIMGGIEIGQTAEDAARMEIEQEAGITDVTIVKTVRWITGARYCASHKQQNRTAIATVLMAEIDSLKDQIEIDDSEQKLHTLVWVDESEVQARLILDHQKYVWRQLQSETAVTGEGEMLNSGKYNGMSASQARDEIIIDLAATGLGREVTNYKMRDWLISRQRYWGAPIPIIHCPKDGAVAVPADQLPVLLPELKSFQPSGDGRSPLGTVSEFVNTTCPTCGGPAQRETDTMDGYACSSWYFLRYIDPHNNEAAWDVELAKTWMPTDFYNGGDHAIAHLLYARFFMRFFNQLGLVDTPEPFKKMYFHGKIMAPDGSAFSKTKGNGPDPLKLIEAGYGADSIRTYIMFISPADMDSPWSEDGVPGCYRFLQRIWALTQDFMDSPQYTNTDQPLGTAKDVLRSIHKTIVKVDADIADIKLNTAIAAMMEAVNELYRLKAAQGFMAAADWRFALESLLQLVAPFAPHIAEELWHQLGHDDTIHIDHWPKYDEKYLVADTMKIAVQVNGKLRGEISVATGMQESQVVAAAQSDEKLEAHLAGKEIRKVIYVPGKLVNFVV